MRKREAIIISYVAPINDQLDGNGHRSPAGV